MKGKITIHHIEEEVKQIRHFKPELSPDSAFVLWFLRAFIVESEEEALKSLTCASHDKGIDAIFADHRAKQVHLVQGKYRHSLGEIAEKRNDVLGLAYLGKHPWEEKASKDSFYTKLDPYVREKLEEAVECILRRKYDFRLFYVTTGRCSSGIKGEAQEIVRHAEGPVELSILDHKEISIIFKDYLEGVAPAVPTLKLRMMSEGRIVSDGTIRRIDPSSKIESWVFTMTAKDVGEMFTKAGIRLFARNVRGYLGESNMINEAMADTVKNQPHNFWYFNNGVTIVCDNVSREQAAQDILRVDRPQVINGQQTTRTLQRASSDRAGVLVKVIKIPRTTGDDNEYEDLVSSIVRATNWQNAIRPSDLVSNDHIQVHLERELRKLGYQYLRKRQTKKEAKRIFGKSGAFQIKKDDFALAVAACELDPSIVLQPGKEALFGEQFYRAIFKIPNIHYYLPRFFLMRNVLSACKGRGDLAYSKWHVMNYVWDRLSKDIGYGVGCRKFRFVCEHKEEHVINKLQELIKGVFRATLLFYKQQTGSGLEAVDRQTFFKRPKLMPQFQKYWSSPKNKTRSTVERRIKKFRESLDRVVDPD